MFGRALDKTREAIAGMPRGAVVTVIVGLVLTALVGVVNLVGYVQGADLEWGTLETVSDPPVAETERGGSLELARTSLATIEATDRGDFLFRVAGVAIIAAGDRPTEVRCEVTAPAPARIARTPQKRAAWPRPSEDLGAQGVPEELVVDFSAEGAEFLGLPVRDALRRFSDGSAPVEVIWDGFRLRSQNWVWTLPEGTGDGAVSLGYTVVFKTTERPTARISCRSSGAKVSTVARQDLWPVPGYSGP